MKKPQDYKWSSALTLPLILSTVMAGAPVMAQDEDKKEEAKDDSLEEIVITGIRGSLKTARDQKRSADTAVDLITASDVSTLPDLSVAEALARVPGVTVQRIGLGADGGDFPSPEGGGNLVRGLTLVRSEFNGRDAFSANGGRALDFGTIPPELIGSVQVFKNSSADLIQGGIGGTINLRTLEPFDREGSIAVVTFDGTYTDLREEFTPDVSVLLGDRWEVSSGEFGLLGSYSRSELKSSLHGFQIGQLYPIPVDPNDDPYADDVERIAIPGGVQLRTNDVDRKRESFYGALQWRNDDKTLEVTAKYARIENTVTSDERTLEWFGDGEMWFQTRPVGDYTTTPFTSAGLPICNGSNDPDPGNAVCETRFPVNGLFENGVITNSLRSWTGASGANFSNLGIHQEEKSTTDDLSLNIKWRPADQWYVNIDAHVTTATSKLERLWAGSRFFSNFEINPSLDNPSLTLVPAADNDPFRITATDNCQWAGCGTPLSTELSDPANTFLIFAADEFRDNDGELASIKADVQYDFDNDTWFESVKFGARYAEREQVNRTAGLNWGALAPPWNGGYYLGLDADPATGSEIVDFSDFFRGGVVLGDNTSVAFVDRDLLSDYDAFSTAMLNDPNVNGDWSPLRTDGVVDYDRGTIGNVLEKTTDAYVRLDFSNEFSNGMSIDGNLGLRYTKSVVSGSGELEYANILDEDVATFSPETVAYFDQESILRSGEFSDAEYWLPSYNVKLNLDDQKLIRFAVSKNITRPDISLLPSSGDVVPVLRYEVDTSTTPSTILDIKPQEIITYGGNPDLDAIESWNYDLSFEYYFGEQDSFTFTLFRKDIKNNIVYDSTTVDTVTLDDTEVAIIYSGSLNQGKSKLKGIEVAYQQFYDFLPGALGNLGLQLNYTYIDAEASPPSPINDTGGDPDAGNNFQRIYRFGVDNYLGLSEHTANIIGIYQDDDLEFRVAYNWRSEHLSSYRDFVTGNPIFQSARGYLDASFKWEINETVQFRLQVADILNTRANAEQQIDEEGQRFGRTSFLGDRRIKAGFRFQF